MMATFSRTVSAHRRSAFSLIEVLIVMSLLSVIVLGLMAMFNQTQRAFRLGMSQTDILESGRMVSDLTARELEQVTPSYMNRTNVGSASIGGISDYAPNVFTETVNVFQQALPGTTGVYRTNILTDLFFVTRQNQTWTGIGYFVRTNRVDDPQFPAFGAGPLGTLYRFETNMSAARFAVNPEGLFAGFLLARNGDLTNYGISKVLNGVVHFHSRQYDPSGWPLVSNPAWFTDRNPVSGAFLGRPESITNGTIQVFNTFPVSGEMGRYWFFSNAVPASIELELGILESPFVERYKAFPIPTAQTDFLSQQAAHVHVFRQRIPIRNVDLSVYQ